MKDASVLGVLAAAGLAMSAQGQTSFAEVEPNETKATATPVTGIADGDTITGNSTGAGTGAGAASVDTFRIKTAARPTGIYRNRLAITTAGAAGHTGTIRGLNQTDGGAGVGGVIGTTDSIFQNSVIGTTPARFNQWYGFGKQEEIYYRVAGTASTTSDYALNFTSTPVTIGTVSGNFAPGSIVITTVGQTGGTQTDTDLWVYDASFNPIATFGCDDFPGGNLGSQLTRVFAAGTYYLAISRFNLANNQPSPGDDNYRIGVVLDFPNAIAESDFDTASASLNVTFRITDSASNSVVTPAARVPYEVLFFKFVVGTPVACYPNCDQSTSLPVLNANDFNCFLNAYAANDSYANCDLSTSVPILNANDFNCFLNAYAAGCS